MQYFLLCIVRESSLELMFGDQAYDLRVLSDILFRKGLPSF